MSYLLLYFYVSSFIGWVLESAFKTFQDKKITNSGFLYGPFVPIYGFGALIVYFSSLLFCKNSQLFQVAVYTFLAVTLEYAVSFIFEKIFGMKLWDYKKEKFNLNGRICLKFSIIWAILIIFVVEIGQKLIFNFLRFIPENLSPILGALLTAYIIIDLIFSFKLFYNFKNVLLFLKNVKISDIKNNLDYIYKMKFDLDVKLFLSPIKKFDNLGKVLRKTLKINNRRIYLYLKEAISSFLKRETGEDLMNYDYSKNEEFFSYISSVIDKEDYKRLQNYKHHDKSIYDHNLKVAYLSFKIGKLLNLKIKELVRGALLHDFFFYDWRSEKPSSGKLHAFEHPKESLKNAKKYFSNLTKVEEDIILKHMWPLTLIPPKYIESFAVSVIDKIVATKEFGNLRNKKNEDILSEARTASNLES